MHASPRARSAAAENISSAKEAGLHYVCEREDGIYRRRRGRGFSYVNRLGKTIRSFPTLRRIKSLVIPPAWKDVWISGDPLGHLQAVGIDRRGRKQYRYHAHWRAVRDENKYDRLVAFGNALPKLRRRISRDLRKPGLPRDKILATVVKLLETTLIRVGNVEYVRENHSYGLTTLRNKHVEIQGDGIHFEFRGKSGIERAVDLHDHRLAKIIRKCQHLPGQELFQYKDRDGARHSIGSHDVNDYLRSSAGEAFTAKDFRTWSGTVLALLALQEFEKFDSETQARRNVVAAIESVAKKLGNTKAVCRKCYIHPAVLDSYLDGHLFRLLRGRLQRNAARNLRALRPEEAAVMTLLQNRLARESRSSHDAA